MTFSAFPSSARLTGLAAALTAALLAGCAAPSPSAPATTAAAAPLASAPVAPTIAVPPSSTARWIDLGEQTAPWLAGDGPVPPTGGASVPTRAVGLQRADGQWLAIVVAQRAPIAGAAACPPANRLEVVDGNGDGCLRLRRNADFDGWMAAQHPTLAHWIDQQGWQAQPRAWVSDRVNGAGGTLQTVALINPALIEPVTRTNGDFLAASEPGRVWARQFAAATRAAADGGTLRVPPFPFAAIATPTPPPAAPVVTAPRPGQAEQVPPARAPQPAPRADRG